MMSGSRSLRENYQSSFVPAHIITQTYILKLHKNNLNPCILSSSRIRERRFWIVEWNNFPFFQYKEPSWSHKLYMALKVLKWCGRVVDPVMCVLYVYNVCICFKMSFWFSNMDCSLVLTSLNVHDQTVVIIR